MPIHSLRIWRCLLAVLCAALPVLTASATQTRGLDVRDMVALDRVSTPRLSPDASMLAMVQRRRNAEGKPESGIYLRHLLTRDLAAPRRRAAVAHRGNDAQGADGGGNTGHAGLRQQTRTACQS